MTNKVVGGINKRLERRREQTPLREEREWQGRQVRGSTSGERLLVLSIL